MPRCPSKSPAPEPALPAAPKAPPPKARFTKPPDCLKKVCWDDGNWRWKYESEDGKTRNIVVKKTRKGFAVKRSGTKKAATLAEKVTFEAAVQAAMYIAIEDAREVLPLGRPFGS